MEPKTLALEYLHFLVFRLHSLIAPGLGWALLLKENEVVGVVHEVQIHRAVWEVFLLEGTYKLASERIGPHEVLLSEKQNALEFLEEVGEQVFEVALVDEFLASVVHRLYLLEHCVMGGLHSMAVLIWSTFSMFWSLSFSSCISSLRSFLFPHKQQQV